ncbi:pentapeptide repeat-containing protein [Geomonas sp. RF6]|uniref:pentapeptide repeat-containing protein n=1 Tax=Geomonas sp. RF6 TaxID=2897342 RepID=UPI001E560C3B|nr:pentapeptide repeat-containing protein [Geomonas sp. RF6]UFS71995.1 pentapeptide repeat-containing protein [Geomonas sp. RF6]
MLHRKTVMITLFLLLTTAASRAAEEAPVTVKDTEGVQLQALKETETKLAALANLPAADAAVPKAARKPHSRKKPHKKPRGHAAATPPHGETKVAGKHLTIGEVNAILAGSRDFSGADLSGLDLAGLDLSGANFSRADLERANLEKADLSETDLQLADLTHANLTRATLRLARLNGTRLWGARCDGALWTDRTVCRSGSLGRCREN